MLVFVGLHVQPLFTSSKSRSQVTESTCPKQKSCSSKKDCPGEKKKCPSEGCNPFVPCSLGMCCYVIENFFTPPAIPVNKKNHLPFVNDSKIAKSLSECWHPPEMLS
jgi:hypothetical protein